MGFTIAIISYVILGIIIAESARFIGSKIFSFSAGESVSSERPMIVTFIGDMNILGAILLIISLFPNFMNKLGIYIEVYPIYSDVIIRILFSIILLIVSLGYLRLKIWSYYLMVISNILSLAICIFLYQKGQHIYSACFIPTFFSLIFILPTRRYFVKKADSE
ncbi:MAG: hypothetical protein WCQ54_13930 [Clostridiaceae bacterium]